MNIKTVCICGAGTMGSGIAQVCASAGLQAILYDLNEAIVENARSRMEKDLQTLVDKQKITAEQKTGILERITFTGNFEHCTADLVIEAVIEKMEVKQDLFNRLSVQNGTGTIFATNTSSLSVSAIADGLSGAQPLAGLHFFNPAPVMKLVEVVRGRNTPEEVIQELVRFAKALGKTPVVCRDSPGFIVNRVARPYYIESLRLAEAGADLATIDRLLESRGFRMGPFKLMDLIGNDVNYAVSCSVYDQLNHPERLRPSYIQEEKVSKGELGRKTKKGYFEY
jgi:3-hydroxybutyryl-CoA dehydrogenase